MLRRFFDALFAVAYCFYVYTPLGAWLHTRSLRRRRDQHTPRHSTPPPVRELSTCDVHTIPMLSDNYGYLLVDRATQQAALVDPCDAEEALAVAAAAGVTVSQLLITHHHVDHSGGNLALRRALPGCKVVGGRGENVPYATHQVDDGDVLKVGHTRIRVNKTPFHTLHHVVYVVLHGDELVPEPFYAEDEGDEHHEEHHVHQEASAEQSRNSWTEEEGEEEAVFSGDVVLPGGCGRLFRGTAATAMAILNDGLFACLPGAALLFPGHEYTVKNMQFACWLLPDSERFSTRLTEAQQRRRMGLATVPVRLRDERRANPFMAVRSTAVRAAVLALCAADEAMPTLAADASAVEVFAALRTAKDRF